MGFGGLRYIDQKNNYVKVKVCQSRRIATLIHVVFHDRILKTMVQTINYLSESEAKYAMVNHGRTLNYYYKANESMHIFP